MMTSKPEDRLRKNGVKTRKYYKWLRWSMKISFIVIFVILCLMTFAILSLSSAKSNAQSVENSINHTKQYYLLSSQGEKTLETIDNYLYQYYQSSTNSDDYFTHIQSLTQIIPDSSIHQHLLTYTLQDQENTLYVEIEILYPGSQLYQIKTWNECSDW